MVTRRAFLGAVSAVVVARLAPKRKPTPSTYAYGYRAGGY